MRSDQRSIGDRYVGPARGTMSTAVRNPLRNLDIPLGVRPVLAPAGGLFPVRKTLSGVIIAIVAAAGGALLAVSATPLSGQAPAAYRAPRAADGQPDLNGIWQANNEANFDLEAHMARPAMALRAGPYGPVPAAAGARARRGRLGAAGHGRRRRRTRFRTSRRRSPRRKRTRRSGSSAIPRSSATCRACRARPTCRSRSRFSRARARSSSRTSTRAPCATST